MASQMPYDVTFDMTPTGYSVSHARRGETASVQYLEFTSTEDGQHFIKRLEGFPDELLRKLSGQIEIRPSQVDHLLAIIRRDKTATVYVNELPHIVKIRIGREIEKGQPVFKNDIVDIDTLELGNVEIPTDCGVLFLFSIGWRKGLFYDFGPLEPLSTVRTFDCGRLFAQLYAHVFFQERFSITDDEWDALFASQWFPFSALQNESIDELVNYVRAGWNPDELIDKILGEINGRVQCYVKSWSSHPTFEPHIDILRKAVEHFEHGDYLSCTGLLYPRIEGIMRTNLNEMGGVRASQGNLSDFAVSARIHNPKCLLLPHKFNQYLKEVYFAGFDPKDKDSKVSRHSVSHGVAPCDKFNAKSALIGILTVHQLFYCCESHAPGTETRDT
jgi:hypothetical protein